ncbi:hypothetical protein EMN47_04265 [Prolixibacteraceae bacterium JC049]|nr:hypothetical protein [Prolixibacteraceae bacterium JC049]
MNNLKKMSLIRVAFYLVLLVVVLGSCKEEGRDNIMEELRVEAMLRFQGDYTLIAAYSEKPVDMNNDGIKSNDLFKENCMMWFSEINIVVAGENDLFMDKNECFVSQSWPTENDSRLKTKEVISTYEKPVYISGYNMFMTGVHGHFSSDLKSCQLTRSPKTSPENTLIQYEEMRLDKNDIVVIVALRRVFTKDGWVTTKVESWYQKICKV